MYGSDEFKQLDNETFALKINTNRAYKILQLTDMHLGVGIFSKKKGWECFTISNKLRKIQPWHEKLFQCFIKYLTQNAG